jgi:eukaryotic-like serine/threonine-protein kinase
VTVGTGGSLHRKERVRCTKLVYNHRYVHIGRGMRLGPYEIDAVIGAGGMGEVYRATDTRLQRAVAIKVLPEGVSSPQRIVRFQREAKTVSSLTHPNICQLFDIGSDHGIDYLVMEYLEGIPLALRLMQGALPMSEAMTTGAEIASALASAHARNVIHRDVKPSNIMMTPSGAKLLDFGIARELPLDGQTDTHDRLTGENAIVGTLAYIAPEQLAGARGDARTDLWGVGVVLYEMVTGRRAFDTESRSDLLTAILTRDPDFDAIADPALRQLIRKCLAKDPDDRWQTARDLADQLRWIADSITARTRSRAIRAAATFAVLVLLATAALAGWTWWRATRAPPPSKLSIAFPAGALFRSASTAIAISPDGRRVFFRAQTGIGSGTDVYSRNLDGFETKLVPEMKNAHNLAFSPDGAWLAYTSGPRLFKVPSTGGTPTDLGPVGGSPRGLSWGSDGTIFFATGLDRGLSAVSSNGSDHRILTIPDAAADEVNHRLPYVLPDGRHVLFTVGTGRISSFDDARIAVLTVETGRWRTILEGGSHPTYVRSGHLVYVHGNSLMAIGFDLATLEVQGKAVPIVSDLLADTTSGVGQYSIATEAGTLAYVPGGRRPESTEMQVVNRQGLVTRTLVVPRRIDSFGVSPDSKQIAVQVSTANDDIYRYDIEREMVTRISSLPGNEYCPAWSHDGESVLFASAKGLYRQSSDGASPAELIVQGRTSQPAASPDGQFIAYAEYLPSEGEIRTHIVRTGDEKTAVTSIAGGYHPAFSPSSRWIAYASRESGRMEVYVRPVMGGGRIQVSREGGTMPRWSRDGRELHYQSDDEFYSVPVASGPALSVGGPQLLFRASRVCCWDIIGEEFLLRESAPEPILAEGIHVYTNWLGDLKARVPNR